MSSFDLPRECSHRDNRWDLRSLLAIRLFLHSKKAKVNCRKWQIRSWLTRRHHRTVIQSRADGCEQWISSNMYSHTFRRRKGPTRPFISIRQEYKTKDCPLETPRITTRRSELISVIKTIYQGAIRSFWKKPAYFWTLGYCHTATSRTN